MRALVLDQTGSPLRLAERPSPAPAPGEAVVRLRAAALNRRDFWIAEGKYPGIRTPVVPGSDGAGVVVRVGEGVDPSWAGRDVLINPGLGWGPSPAAQGGDFQVLGMPRDGTFAEETAIPAAQLHAKPAHLGWPEAAALPLAGVTAYRALFVQGGLRAGETLLITGAGGGVAAAALLFAVAAGARVWVTSSSPEKIRRAMELGARGGFDYTDPGWVKAAAAFPPDLVLDGAGGAGFAGLIQLAPPGGRIVCYGATAGAPGGLDLFRLFWKQLRVTGCTMGSPDDFAAMLAFVERHRIVPVVDAVRPLAEGAAALEGMRAASQFGKVVLKIA